MRGETADGCARYPAAQFHRGDDLLQAGDGRARERFAIELEVEAAVFFIRHLNGRGILPTQPNKNSPMRYTGVEFAGSPRRTTKALAPSPKSPPNSPATRPGVRDRLCTSAVTTATAPAAPELIND